MFDESHEFLTKKDKYLWRVEKLSITSKEVLVASTFENHRPQVHFFQSEKRNETFVAKLRKRKKEKDNWIPILQNVSHILRLNIFVSIPYPIRNNNNNFITRMKKKKILIRTNFNIIRKRFHKKWFASHVYSSSNHFISHLCYGSRIQRSPRVSPNRRNGDRSVIANHEDSLIDPLLL